MRHACLPWRIPDGRNRRSCDRHREADQTIRLDSGPPRPRPARRSRRDLWLSRPERRRQVDDHQAAPGRPPAPPRGVRRSWDSTLSARILICFPTTTIQWFALRNPRPTSEDPNRLSPGGLGGSPWLYILSLIHISEPTRLGMISY